ncbi:MAG: flagellar export protein FliJ [Shewanella sp.]|nr:flagellar export protein FliJ [Shewanella sp.]MCF1429757.1 flagellar export protein FliJ [Shewanella sp.]MCF1438847.1 flagellar export protein FliJ [Shewanella sp.]MCF1457050.1 flagellar export protein FliJ [Shewanella sp.]
MTKDPLLTVFSLAQESEEQAGLQLRAAQSELQKQESQLQALNQYRLDYMQQLKDKSNGQVSITFYQQFHKFIKQIDDAISQQIRAVSQAEEVWAHRQQHWLEQQRKRKSVEQLLEKKARTAEMKQTRLEQKLSDEFTMQQCNRRQAR